MSAEQQLSTNKVKLWLNELGIEHFVCENCHGLHLSKIQAMDGILESRLFVEEWGVLISTEFKVRPGMILPLQSEMGQLNANFPALKIFLDSADEDSFPQLIAGSTQLTGAGISQKQFAFFVSSSLEMISQLTEDLSEMACLTLEEEPEDSGYSLH